MLAPLLDPLAPSLAIPMSPAISAKADNRANTNLRTRRHPVISLERSSVAFEPVHSVRKQLIEIPNLKSILKWDRENPKAGLMRRLRGQMTACLRGWMTRRNHLL